MISVEMVMLAMLGFLTAALLALFIAPLYRKRVARLTTEALKRSMPLTETEIRADKDRLRAEFAIRIHKLETKVEEASEASARQMVEFNRRDANISELEGELNKQRTSLEEHENARRVLEQTIMDRLPKVEHRLAEARKLLFQRDREIVALTQSSEKHARAIEEATQINAQQTDEVHRLKAALNTRASRSRDGFGDPRYDGEVALRTEIESLRAKTREQTALIARLQSLVARAGPAVEAADASSIRGSGDAMRPAKVRSAQGAVSEPMTPPPLKPADRFGEAPAPDPQAQNEIRRLKAVNQDQAAELSRFKAALATYEAADQDDRGVKESKIALKARLSALQALTDEQNGTIQALRTELAAGNEKLARQAAYFMEEMRRLGSVPAPGPSRRGAEGDAKRPLAERINDPRVARFPGMGSQEVAAAAPAAAPPLDGIAASEDSQNRESPEPRRGGGFLKALEAATLPVETRVEHAPGADAANGQGAPGEVKRTRKARLLDRITGLDKNSA